MTRIAICDDESIMLDKISLYINTYTTNKQIDNCEIFRFNSATALIQAMDSGNSFDIFILDIYIGDEMGTSLAKDIRKRGIESPIIFLTASLEHAPMGYEVGTLRYLIKPIDQTKFFEAMDAAFTQSEKVIKNLLKECDPNAHNHYAKNYNLLRDDWDHLVSPKLRLRIAIDNVKGYKHLGPNIFVKHLIAELLSPIN